jgi:uncharacterized phage protein gp47/JayE
MGYFEAETATTIAQRAINKVVARTNLTDLTQTSEFYQVIMACARACEKTQQGMEDLLDDTDIDKATGEMLDEIAKKLNPDLIERLTGTKATGSVVFSRAGTTGEVTIPIGTQVKVPKSIAGEDLVYTTTTVGTISDGNNDSNSVDIVANDVGTKYRADPNTIVGFVGKPAGVDTVTNAAAITNGLDEETDDEFRTRIKDYINSLSKSTVKAIEFAARNTQDSGTGKRVRWASVYENEWDPGKFVCYVDDGSGTAEDTTQVTGSTILTATGGEVDIYVSLKPIKGTAAYTFYVDASPLVEGTDYWFNPASGHIKLTESYGALSAGEVVTGDFYYYTGLIAEVQKVIDGDSGDRTNYPGWRAGGILAEVRAPTISYQTVYVNVSILDGYDHSAVYTDVETEISIYINSLAIAENVIVNELIERIMGVPGVYDCNMTSPSENVIVTDSQIARVTDSLITVV